MFTFVILNGTNCYTDDAPYAHTCKIDKPLGIVINIFSEDV